MKVWTFNTINFISYEVSQLIYNTKSLRSGIIGKIK